ncbi:hypothetical protein NWI01_09960 [Nitrobacter winogradskyi]|uniref:Uncharacterized protein n=1 Tax=Nitrobacter winogradskyi TaxID=913 RepID=A0A4Y3W7Y1_NITWI|nr:hypothetical protein NWI01_09960 [Nitrobacter winogradskyi]
MIMPTASGAEGAVVRTGNARVAATARGPRTTGHQEVITSTSVQRIVAGTAVNAVIAGPAEQQVIAFARPDHIVAAAAVDRIVAAIMQVDRIMPFACGDKDVVIPSGHVKPGAVIIQHDRFQVGVRLDIRRVGYPQNLDDRRNLSAWKRPGLEPSPRTIVVIVEHTALLERIDQRRSHARLDVSVTMEKLA